MYGSLNNAKMVKHSCFAWRVQTGLDVMKHP